MIYMECTLRLLGDEVFQELMQTGKAQIKRTASGVNYVLIEEEDV